jgi:predicted enzyme related to lactoylglutathione lyase
LDGSAPSNIVVPSIGYLKSEIRGKLMAEEGVGKVMQLPKHGEFCWSEIACTDLEKCKAFYTNIFGWQFTKSQNTGDEMQYLEFSSASDERPDAALYEMNPAMFGGTVPPAHIAQYVSVDSVDESIARITELGGSIVFGPYDIPKVGRMAVGSDPTGAVISLITLSGEE